MCPWNITKILSLRHFNPTASSQLRSRKNSMYICVRRQILGSIGSLRNKSWKRERFRSNSSQLISRRSYTNYYYDHKNITHNFAQDHDSDALLHSSSLDIVPCPECATSNLSSLSGACMGGVLVISLSVLTSAGEFNAT